MLFKIKVESWSIVIILSFVDFAYIDLPDIRIK